MDAGDLLNFSARTADLNGELWPAVILLGGAEYAAAVPEPRVIPSLITGGEIMDGQLVARVKTSLMPTKPLDNQPLRWKRPGEATWRTEVWWVGDVTKSPLDVEWVIRCGPKN
jgi:hypothetical protein